MDGSIKKPLPVGVEHFEKMINKNYYYVDKTLMIKDLLDKGSDVNLFTRPRRFGKSLNISMLQYYFENLKKDDAHLFDGLHIMEAGDRYLKHQNQYPVIKLSLKEASKKTFESSMNMLKMDISREFERHRYVLKHDGLDETRKELYQKLLSRKADLNEYENSLRFLSECLDMYYNQKAIILIDEYDVPLEKAYFNGYYDEMVNFIRSFFSGALKTNDALEFSVMTGCLRVSKESIFTGVNNLNIVSILSDNYGECFGFTESEVKEMLAYYELPHKADEMRDWYNGYLFGETIVYNPWSSIKYLADVIYGKMPFPNPHWSNTSSNDIIRQLIAVADDEAKDEIELLIAGETITKPIREDIVYGDITKNMNNLWNFLYFTGYLKKVSKRQIGVENHFDLMIPNNEILYIYQRQIREWFDDRVKAEDVVALYTAILNQDVEPFIDGLNEVLGETISYMDSHENFYHGFLVGVLRGIKGYVVKSNRESGDGRGDIFLMPRTSRKPAIVIEVKVANHLKELEKACDAALKQIEEKKYEEALRYEGYRQIITYGISFYRKECLIKTK